MRARYTVILALLLVALGAYLYFVESKRIAAEGKKDRVLTLVPEDATRITLTYPDDSEVVLELREGSWRLTKPVDAVADDITVKDLLRTIADTEVVKTIDDPPTDLAQFGLAEPMVTVTVTAKDQVLPALKVGKKTTVSSLTYAQRADHAKIFLAGAGFHNGMDKHFKDFRDKTIITFKDDDIAALTMTGPGGAVELRKRDGTWMIEQPVATRADDSTIRSLLSTIRGMRAEDFASDNPTPADLAAFGLDQPEREIILRDTADKERRLQFGTEFDKGLYVKVADRPTAFIVGTWASRDLGKSLGELRDKTVLQFDPAAVGSIQVRRSDGEAFTLLHTDDAWAVDGATGASETGKIKTFVDALAHLKGSRVLSDNPQDLRFYGLATPVVTIAVIGKDGSALGTVRVGTKPPDEEGKGTTRYTATRENDTVIAELLGYQFNQLDQKKENFLPTSAAPTPSPTAGAG